MNTKVIYAIVGQSVYWFSFTVTSMTYFFSHVHYEFSFFILSLQVKVKAPTCQSLLTTFKMSRWWKVRITRGNKQWGEKETEIEIWVLTGSWISSSLSLQGRPRSYRGIRSSAGGRGRRAHTASSTLHTERGPSSLMQLWWLASTCSNAGNDTLSGYRKLLKSLVLLQIQTRLHSVTHTACHQNG